VCSFRNMGDTLVDRVRHANRKHVAARVKPTW
jgi:hypothetical protein